MNLLREGFGDFPAEEWLEQVIRLFEGGPIPSPCVVIPLMGWLWLLAYKDAERGN